VNIHMKNGLRINHMALKEPATDRGFRIEEFKTSISTTWSHFEIAGVARVRRDSGNEGGASSLTCCGHPGT